MSGQVLLEDGKDFSWEGNILVANSPEGVKAINNALRNVAWPFIEQLCSLAGETTESHITVIFNSEFNKFEKAEQVLKENAPVVSSFS